MLVTKDDLVGMDRNLCVQVFMDKYLGMDCLFDEPDKNFGYTLVGNYNNYIQCKYGTTGSRCDAMLTCTRAPEGPATRSCRLQLWYVHKIICRRAQKSRIYKEMRVHKPIKSDRIFHQNWQHLYHVEKQKGSWRRTLEHACCKLEPFSRPTCRLKLFLRKGTVLAVRCSFNRPEQLKDWPWPRFQ